MYNQAPIRRDKNLMLLSREHHTGLLTVWKIRQGLRLNISTERIADFIINGFECEEEPHFCEEEQLLFPLLPEQLDLRLNAEADHAAIRKIVAVLHQTARISVEDIEAFANLLEAHIRFEERILFHYIEKEVAPDVLDKIGYKLSVDHEHKVSFEWEDAFWLKPKQTI